jgi:hypothetical protein
MSLRAKSAVGELFVAHGYEPAKLKVRDRDAS